VSSFNADILDPATGGSLLQSGNYYAVSKEREEEFIKREILEMKI
jgi:hypothetical protein